MCWVAHLWYLLWLRICRIEDPLFRDEMRLDTVRFINDLNRIKCRMSDVKRIVYSSITEGIKKSYHTIIILYERKKKCFVTAALSHTIHWSLATSVFIFLIFRRKIPRLWRWLSILAFVNSFNFMLTVVKTEWGAKHLEFNSRTGLSENRSNVYMKYLNRLNSH